VLKPYSILSKTVIALVFTLLSASNSFGLSGNTRAATSTDDLAAIAKIGGATGILIGSNVLLTAGHVIQFGLAKQEDIKITFPESKDPERTFDIDHWKAADHGMFPSRYLDHSGQDLAVIFLKENAQELLSIHTIALYTQPSDTLLGQKVMLAGYGRSQLNQEGQCSGPTSEKLRVATSEIRELLHEEGKWGAPVVIGTPDVTPCDGDSGSPALITINQERYVVAITSGPYNPTPGTHLGRNFQYADIGSAINWLLPIFINH
jgi:V8-like Glu-specific endopeptidase